MLVDWNFSTDAQMDSTGEIAGVVMCRHAWLAV